LKEDNEEEEKAKKKAKIAELAKEKDKIE